MIGDFDPMDPLGLNSRIVPLPPPGQPMKIPALTPVEQESILSRLGGATLGGLGYAGSVLDKTFGGRAIRGLLGGKPRELLSILPGSDTLGITDPQERVHGKELLGLDDDSWGSTLAGVGAELALDPAMYLSFGTAAIGKGGQVAKAAGVLPRTATGRVTQSLADLLAAAPAATQPGMRAAMDVAATAKGYNLPAIMGEKLGGVAGVGLPFAEPSMLLGQGAGGAAFLDALGKGGSFLAHTLPGTSHVYNHAIEPLGRHMNALFDPTVLGARTKEGQAAARELSEMLRPMVAARKGEALGWGETLHSAGYGPTTGDELRMAVEGTMQGPHTPAMGQVSGEMRAALDAKLKQLQGLGVDISQLQDRFAQFSPRQATPLDVGSTGYGGSSQPLAMEGPLLKPREDIYRNLVGGTEGVNAAAVDPMISGPGRQLNQLQSAQYIREQYLGHGIAEETERMALMAQKKAAAAGIPGTPPWTFAEEQRLNELTTAFTQGEKLATRLSQLDPAYAASAGSAAPLRFFGNHPLQDYMSYMEKAEGLNAAAQTSHNLIGRTAIDTATGAAPVGGVPVLKAIADAGLTGPSADLALSNALAQAGHAITGPQDLARFVVPENIAGELTRYLRGFQTPESVTPVLAGYDQLTKLFKGFQTSPFPAFHIRNLISGLWQNLVKGGFEPGMNQINGFVKPIQDIKGLLAGNVVKDANAIPGLTHLSPEEATSALGREMAAQGIYGANMTRELNAGAQAVPASRGTLDALMGTVPGYTPKTVGSALEGLKTTNLADWNPLDVDKFAPVAAGRNVGDVVEGVNRGSLYLALRRQGYTAEQAAKEVLEAHFDYGRLGKTDFERQFMTRVAPFYTYARGVIPFVLNEIARRPGGLTGVIPQVAYGLHDDDKFLPDYLGQGLHVPIGGEEGGTQRYLTRTDLPAEQALDYVKGGPHAMQNTLLGLLAQSNPIIKAPLEYAFGKQAFTGREAEDLYSLTGNPLSEALLFNSPISRLVTTGRTLADERKYQDPFALPLNLTTGFKVSDIDMEKQRAIAGRELVQEFLRGQPEIGRFQQLYLKPGMEGLLSPQEYDLLRLNRTLEQNALKKARALQLGHP